MKVGWAAGLFVLLTVFSVAAEEGGPRREAAFAALEPSRARAGRWLEAAFSVFGDMGLETIWLKSASVSGVALGKKYVITLQGFAPGETANDSNKKIAALLAALDVRMKKPKLLATVQPASLKSAVFTSMPQPKTAPKGEPKILASEFKIELAVELSAAPLTSVDPAATEKRLPASLDAAFINDLGGLAEKQNVQVRGAVAQPAKPLPNGALRTVHKMRWTASAADFARFAMALEEFDGTMMELENIKLTGSNDRAAQLDVTADLNVYTFPKK